MMRKVTPGQAFEDYVALGYGRSLSKLEARYRNDPGVIQISSATLRRWSSKFRWQARLAEHDEKVATQVEDKLVKAQADERWNAAQACRDAAKEVIKRGVEMLPGVQGKNGADVKAIFDTAINLLGKADVLEGGISDSTETRGKPDYASMLGEFDDYRGLGQFRDKAEARKAEARKASVETAKDRGSAPEGDDDQ